jgi:heme exporter protein A
MSLTATGLACDRGGRRIFSGLSFAVVPGEALLLTGPNGSGKSTLLKLIAGLLPLAEGTLEKPERLAYLAHENALKPQLSVWENVNFWTRLAGLDDAVARQGLAAMNLLPLAQTPVRLLSSGQRRRTALASIVSRGTPIWLLDEPTTGLDTASVDRLSAEIARHRAAGGMVLAATHIDLRLTGARELRLGA